MKKLFGKVKKTKDGYFLKSYVAPVLTEFELEYDTMGLELPLPKIEIKENCLGFVRVYCPICGYVGGIYHGRPEGFNLETFGEIICDVCAERECPELFKKLSKMREKCWKEWEEKHKQSEVSSIE